METKIVPIPAAFDENSLHALPVGHAVKTDDEVIAGLDKLLQPLRVLVAQGWVPKAIFVSPVVWASGKLGWVLVGVVPLHPEAETLIGPGKKGTLVVQLYFSASASLN